jgi:hypothetical protein
MLSKITINQRLLNLIENKNIVIVGPAPYLKGLNRGAEFDNSDVIARPNEIIPPKKLRKDYGSRTDLFFCNFGTIWMPGIKRKLSLDDHDDHFKKIKLVIGSAIKAHHSEGDFLSWPDNHVSAIPNNFQSINKYNLPFYWIGVKDYKKIYKNIGVEFNTGIAAMSILLCYPIKSLKISGFTLYKGGNTYEQLYYKGHMDEIDTAGRPFGFSAGHGNVAHTKQIAYARKLMQHYKEKIVLDKELQEILQ